MRERGRAPRRRAHSLGGSRGRTESKRAPHPTQERVRLVLVDNEDGDDVSIISEICIDEPPPRLDDDELSDDEVMPTPKRRGPPVSREKPPPKRRRDPPKRSQMKHPSQEEKHAWPANAPHGAGLIGHKIRVWWPPVSYTHLTLPTKA